MNLPRIGATINGLPRTSRMRMLGIKGLVFSQPDFPSQAQFWFVSVRIPWKLAKWLAKR